MAININNRKLEHLKICIEKDVESGSAGFEEVKLAHHSCPDIDFDEMFTEPAPLDALIQRFGRINRKRKKGICSVNVCREGGENDHYIYPETIVKNTLDVLRDVTVIKEKELQ